ncbi:MAG: hypothetical protein QXO69_03045 [archaeon]
MINALSPFYNPLGYIILSFVSAVVSSDYVQIFYLAVTTSVICFPFALLGLKIHKKAIGKKKARALDALKTTAITVLLFWLATRAWYIIVGFGLPSVEISSLLLGLVFSVIIAFVFVVFAKWLNEKIEEKYNVPFYLRVYILCVASSLLFYLVSTALFMINYGLVFK